MTAREGELAYYIDDYSDEVVPCDCTLEGWANWLAAPDPNWDRFEAAKDGDTFSASVMRFGADIIATPSAEGWTFSRDAGEATFLAVRFGPGMGWDAEGIVDNLNGAREVLAEHGDDGEEFIATGFKEPPVILTFHTDPPRLTVDVQQ